MPDAGCRMPDAGCRMHRPQNSFDAGVKGWVGGTGIWYEVSGMRFLVSGWTGGQSPHMIGSPSSANVKRLKMW
jgi:hypothetical protein